jgi:hypothetical protein
MSYSIEQALHDENRDPNQVPTHGDIGRQYKRLKVADNLSDMVDAQNVTETTVGERTVGLVNLSLQSLTDTMDPSQAGLIAVIQTAVTNAINTACGPDGAVTNAISTACGPNGAVTNAINTACGPNGAVTNAINTACGPDGAVTNAITAALLVTELKAIARQKNSQIRSPTGTIFALVNSAGVPVDPFPATLGDFWSLDLGSINHLLVAYRLGTQGNLAAKRRRLAEFCNIQPFL